MKKPLKELADRIIENTGTALDFSEIEIRKMKKENDPWDVKAFVMSALEASSHDDSLKRLREWVENKIAICRQNIDDWEKEPQESYILQRGIQINKDRIVAFQLVLSEIDKAKKE